jgi:hypothetical protein
LGGVICYLTVWKNALVLKQTAIVSANATNAWLTTATPRQTDTCLTAKGVRKTRKETLCLKVTNRKNSYIDNNKTVSRGYCFSFVIIKGGKAAA